MQIQKGNTRITFENGLALSASYQFATATTVVVSIHLTGIDGSALGTRTITHQNAKDGFTELVHSLNELKNQLLKANINKFRGSHGMIIVREIFNLLEKGRKTAQLAA